MSSLPRNLAAALAAVLITAISVSHVVTVPPAQAATSVIAPTLA